MNSRKRLCRSVMATLVAALILVPSLLAMPTSALNGTAAYTPKESNIAGKYWVTASASTNSDQAKLAVDDDLNSTWSAGKTNAASWFMLDLGGTYDAVRKTVVVFDSAYAAYQYKLEGSTDGSKWTLLADRTGNTQVAGGFTDIFSQKGLRYLKLTITGGVPVAIREFRVINYLRDNMYNGSDMSEQGSNNNTYYYNAGNTPPMEGYRGGRLADPQSAAAGNSIFGLVKDFGWDVIRLRIWNEAKNENNGNPSNYSGGIGAGLPQCSPAVTLLEAKALKAAGVDTAIDFHYADSWSDPQNQPKPYAWADLSFDALVQATYDFTYKTIADLAAQGTAPTVVAIGNEITNGMMWGKEYDDISGVDKHHYYTSGRYAHEYGGGIIWKYWHKDEVTTAQYQQYLDSCQRLARLVDAGVRAVRKVSTDYNTAIMTEVHCAFNVVEGAAKVPLPDSEKFPKVKEFITQLTGRLSQMGSKLDRIGVSYYQDWHGSYGELERNLVEISKLLPGTLLNIAECSPPYSGTARNDNNKPDGTPYTIQSQGDDIADLLSIINNVPNNVGQGVWPWNGTSVFFTGSGVNGTARASMQVWKDAYAKNVLESSIYCTTTPGTAPVLPATVKNMDVTTGAKSDVPVTWDAVAPAAYAGAGSFEVNGTATVDGNMKSVKATVTVGANSFTIDKSKVLVDEPFQIIVKAPAGVQGMILTNENGGGISLQNLQTTVSGDVKTFTATVKVGTAGKRDLRVWFDYDGSGYVNSGLAGEINVTKTAAAPEVISVTPPSSAKVNVLADYTIKTNAEGAYSANISTASDPAAACLGKTVVSKTLNADGTCTWVLKVKIGTAGNPRRLYAYAGNSLGEKSAAKAFDVVVSLI